MTPLLRRTPRNSDACASLTLRRTVVATANPELFHLDGPLQQVESVGQHSPDAPGPEPRGSMLQEHRDIKQALDAVLAS